MNDLVVDLGAHVLFSIAAGLLAWKIYGSKGWQSLFVAQLFAFLSGLFIDIDHLFDYFLAYGPRFDLYTFLYNHSAGITGKTYVLFHGFEYALLLFACMIWSKKRQYKMIFLALLISMLFHLYVDMVIYSIAPQNYFILYRIAHHFNKFH